LILKPRAGHIQFLNCLPLYHGLSQTGVLAEIELIKGTPTELNQWLLQGKLDFASISSIEYCRNHEQLVLMPDLTISSDGEVWSVLLFSKVPIEELHGRTIALTNISATSHVLLQIILKDRYRVNANYFVCPRSAPCSWKPTPPS
jgi:chorismate dehydratase